MRLLFIADVVGQPGRRAVREFVPKLRAQHGIGLVVANGENAAGGSGITPKIAEELYSSGVDIITCGDHLWDQREVTVTVEAQDQGGGISGPWLMQNGSRVAAHFEEERRGDTLYRRFSISLLEGENRLETKAGPSDGSWDSEPATIVLLGLGLALISKRKT